MALGAAIGGGGGGFFVLAVVGFVDSAEEELDELREVLAGCDSEEAEGGEEEDEEGEGKEGEGVEERERTTKRTQSSGVKSTGGLARSICSCSFSKSAR